MGSTASAAFQVDAPDDEKSPKGGGGFEIEPPDKPGILDQAVSYANQKASKALSAAGLPTSLSDVGHWAKGMFGQNPDSKPFYQPVVDAIHNPTQRNVVGAVPFVGPTAVSMSDDVRAGNYGDAAATLGGALGGALAMKQAPAGLNAAKSELAAGRDTVADIAGEASGHSMTAGALKRVLPRPPEPPDFHGGAYSTRAAEEAEAEDMNKARRIQEPVLRREAAAKTKAATADAKAAVTAAKNAPKPSPFGNATSSSTPVGDARVPPVGSTPLPKVAAPPEVAAPSSIGEQPSGVTVLPEPNQAPPGHVNLMGSVPRGTLQDLAMAGKPGAGEQLQHLGPVIYAPKGTGIETPSMGSLRQSLGYGDVGDTFRPASIGPQITVNPTGASGARPITPGLDQFESSFGPEHQEVGDLAEWETGNREGVKPKKPVAVPDEDE